MDIRSSFTKTTEIVVQFNEKKVGQDRFDNDCETIRMIIGKTFPVMTEKNEMIPIVRKIIRNEKNERIRNLDEFERIAKDYGIVVSYDDMRTKGYHIDEEVETPKEWKYELDTYLETKNDDINKVVDEQDVSCDIYFRTRIVSVETSQGDISGNHFFVRTKSDKSEKHLKESHRAIVHALLVELNKVDEIKAISFHCGDVDVETTTRGKIACVLDVERDISKTRI